MSRDDFLSIWKRGTKEQITTDDISHIKKMLPGLDECQCERLHRSLPFRTYMEKKIVSQNKHKPDITYASIGSGDLLFDWIILNKLIMHGTQNLKIIAIDSAYADLIHACNTHNINIHSIAQMHNRPFAKTIQTFFYWLQDAKVYTTLEAFTLYVYESIEAYQSACKHDEAPKTDIYVSIDNDISIPEFEDPEFRENFFAQSCAICASPCRIYYLFYAPYSGDEYRHAIMGQVYPHDKPPILLYVHAYGTQAITHQHINLFIPEQVLPFISKEQSGIQIEDEVFLKRSNKASISILSTMLEHPLQEISQEEQAIIIKQVPELITARAQRQDA